MAFMHQTRDTVLEVDLIASATCLALPGPCQLHSPSFCPGAPAPVVSLSFFTWLYQVSA